MNKRIIILTKSSKFGKLCVAGIDYATGEWVRLVSTDDITHGAVSPSVLRYENGCSADLLDVIDVEVMGNENNPIQPENYIMDSRYRIKYIRSVTIYDVINLCEGQNNRFILGNTSYYVDEENAASIGKSLCLAIVDDLCFEQGVNDSGQPKIKLSFSYKGYRYTNMSVTDPHFYSVLNGKKYGQAAIVVSIGTAFRGHCYKFVSAIYVLIPSC